MPKIVDKDKMRFDLAFRAIRIFQEHGYRGLGMRQIAKELGVSKSALYHYFASKEELFDACTEQVMSRIVEFPNLSQEEKPLEVLFHLFLDIESEFRGELSLLLDYIRTLSKSEIASDERLNASHQAYLKMVSSVTGPKHAQAVLCMLYGLLLQRLLDGGQTSFTEVTDWIKRALGALDGVDISQ